MNNQNTPVHIKLWHKDFRYLSIANMLLAMSVYMLIPVMPLWLMTDRHMSELETGVCMGVFGVGIYLLGPFCSYLVQHFRRNHVCLVAIGAIVVCLLALMIPPSSVFSVLNTHPTALCFHRVALGMFFGLAQMILSSTLIIDTCESFHRTEANYSASWVSRFSLALGPMAGLILSRLGGFQTVVIASAVCCLVSLFLISVVRFPFRAPTDEVRKVSLDRFFLPQGKWLFVNMILVTSAIGLLMTTALTDWFYGLMMVGFLLAILAQRFVFPEAELKSEIVTGLILMSASFLMLLLQTGDTLSWLSPVGIGLGIGIVGSRFLLFFIKLSRHCQRGTSQSTFMLCWESGIALGLFMGYAFCSTCSTIVSLALIIIALLFYHFFTHRWFLSHKNR
jgi:MFS family permease